MRFCFVLLLITLSQSYVCTMDQDKCDSLSSVSAQNPISFSGDGEYCGCQTTSGSDQLTMAIPIQASIPPFAFYENNVITTATIFSDDCQEIGQYAFYNCRNLNYVYISQLENGITTVKEGAFQNSVESIQGLRYLTLDGDGIFQNSKLTSVSIPKEWVTIPKDTFSGCQFIESISFEDGSNLQTIGDSAFQNAFNQENYITINFPDSVKEIANRAFFGSNIQEVNTWPSGLSKIGDYAFSTQSLNSIDSFPLFLKEIGSNAFQNTQITTISLNSNLENIGDFAFEGTRLNRQIYLSFNIQTIGNSAFKGTQIRGPLTLNRELLEIGDSAFEGCTNLDGQITLNDKLQTIGNSAFKGTQISGSLTLNTELTTIGNSAFEGTNLDGQITLNDKLQTIGNSAFKGTQISGSLTLNTELTTIGNSAFEGCVNLNGKLTFNEKITSIGNSAFKNTNLGYDYTEVPSSATIGSDAFEGCHVLIPENPILEDLPVIPDYCFSGKEIQDLTFNPKLESIGNHAFENCKIGGNTKITFPNTLTQIGNYAFHNAIIESREIEFAQDSIITTIGDYAFQGTQITFDWGNLPSSLTSIGDYAFEGTKSKGTFAITEPTSTLEIGKYAFNKVTPAFSGNLVIPEDVELNEKAFGELSLSSITVDGASINARAFAGTTVSGSININDNSDIGSNAFSDTVLNGGASNALLLVKNTANLQKYGFNGVNFVNGGKIVVRDCAIKENSFEGIKGYPTLEIQHDEKSSSRIQIKEEAFYNSQLSGNLEINDFVSYIGTRAFAHCSFKDTNLFIDSVSIHDYAFAYSTGIKELTLGEHVVTFGTDNDDNFHGFERCDFTKLTLNLKGKIPNRAFYRLTSITSDLTFSEDITGIGNEAFAGCSGIPSIAFAPNPAKPLSIGYSAFYGCSEIASDLSFDRDISTIPSEAFCGCSKIKSVSFPNEITEIKDGAFYECKGLGSIKLPAQLSTLGSKAFYGCSNMKGDLIIPNGLGTISSYAFYDCSSLDGKLEIGDSVRTIGSYAFCRCGFTGDLIISQVTKIDEGAFLECSNFNGKLDLINITIGYLSLGNRAFEGCSKICGPIDINAIKSIGERAFSGCSSLTGQLNFYSDVDTINKYIFNGCSSLTGPINWPSSVSSIGEYAFNGCSGLSGDLNLPSGVTQVFKHAFHGCSGLTGSIFIRSSLTLIEEYAFADCSGLSGTLRINVNSGTKIERNAFDGCKGFKNGNLIIFMQKNEEKNLPSGEIGQYYRFNRYLRIENEAFENCKFKNIYFNGRFNPDCDYDIGISKIKGIHTSSNYANKSFCSYPIHSDKLSGGAIAGITIACIVVVAVIVFLIIFFIIRAKKKRDNSEGEVD